MVSCYIIEFLQLCINRVQLIDREQYDILSHLLLQNQFHYEYFIQYKHSCLALFFSEKMFIHISAYADTVS